MYVCVQYHMHNVEIGKVYSKHKLYWYDEFTRVKAGKATCMYILTMIMVEYDDHVEDQDSPYTA